MSYETIIARATPIGSGAIALIRLSGNDVFKITEKSASLFSGKNFSDLLPNTIHYGFIIDKENNEKID